MKITIQFVEATQPDNFLNACDITVFHGWVISLLVAGFFASILIICLGISTLYQAKIYGEVKARPIYIAKETNVK